MGRIAVDESLFDTGGFFDDPLGSYTYAPSLSFRENSVVIFDFDYWHRDSFKSKPARRHETEQPWAQRDSNPRHLPCKGSALAN
jgi:hypothetical protein